MMPRRRLSVVVATGALVLAALAGCQVEPGNAAFVGDDTYSQSGVDDIAKQAAAAGGIDRSKLRDEIVRDEVFVDVARRYAEEHNFGSPKTDAEGVASQLGLPADDPLVQLLAKMDGYRQLLLGKVEPVQPTDAELREAYGHAAKSGVNGSYEELLPSIRGLAGFNEAVAVNRVLTDALQRYHVRLNPLYNGDFDILAARTQSGQSIDIVVLSLAGKDSGSVVHDVSAQ
jgi:hypothetical protein